MLIYNLAPKIQSFHLHYFQKKMERKSPNKDGVAGGRQDAVTVVSG